jgi:hypothetical protein
MTHFPTLLPNRTRKALCWTAAAAAAVALTATPASAAGPGQYSVSATSGATFSFFTANNLVHGVRDEGLFYLSTTTPGALRLPFKIHFYAGVFSKLAISPNGTIQMNVGPGGGAPLDYFNDCLASVAFDTPTAAVFWDDLSFDSNDHSLGYVQGVFTKTKGTAPHRTYTVSWQGHQIGTNGAPVLAQVIFNEGSPTVTYIYGRSGGDFATVGVQAYLRQSATQWTCNSEIPTAVTSGLRLTWLHAN